MHRQIAHIDLDAFFVSVERLKNPDLVGKPVIVGGKGPRGVVCSASYEARKFGVKSAMPGTQAARLCPEGIFVWSNPSEYHHYSRIVTDIINEKVPLVEKASIDEFYMDLSGMDKYFGTFSYLLDLKKQITRESGLPVSVALAANKLISKIATNEAKPNGQIEIPPGTEQAWLAPMPVGKIPGAGNKTEALLKSHGLERIGQIVAAGPELLERLLGKWGLELHRKAMGIDESPVTPFHEAKSISAEETFDEDTRDMPFLERELVRLTEKVAYELRKDKKLAGCVTIKMRHANFETFTRQQTLDFTASDEKLIRKAIDIFRQHYQPGTSLRLIGVRLSQLESDGFQLNLFDNQDEDKELYSAIDDIRRSFGRLSIVRAAGLQNARSRQESGPLWINRNAEMKEGDGE